jgi:uncharacterized membrane protein YhaH (DUF805 family)
MPEAGWYDDPDDSTQLRWWDGDRWSDRRQPRAPREETPPPPPPPSGVGSGWEDTPGATFATVGTGAAPPRTFVEAIKVCLAKYVDGKGRASRSEYWYFALFSFVVDVATGGVAAIFLLLPSITVSVRRLHDIGKSAWALLWIFLPFIGWAVLLYYAVKPGEPAPNAWG